MTLNDTLARLRALESAHNREGMARFGITTDHALGISVTTLRALAKETGRDHALALALWDTGIHEARILATIIADPTQITRPIMDKWVADFDSWDICDGACNNCFRRSPLAHSVTADWCAYAEEYGRRAGFSMIAVLATHDKKSEDSVFFPYLDLVRHYADDERNFVKKAVNWALREIGHRSPALRMKAVQLAEELAASDSRSAKWIARDALREFARKPL